MAGLVLDEMFWGLWLLPLGFLVSRSGYFPRWLGNLLMVGCFSWMGRQFVDAMVSQNIERAGYEGFRRGGRASAFDHQEATRTCRHERLIRDQPHQDG